jgi:hypothetical protein
MTIPQVVSKADEVPSFESLDDGLIAKSIAYCLYRMLRFSKYPDCDVVLAGTKQFCESISSRLSMRLRAVSTQLHLSYQSFLCEWWLLAMAQPEENSAPLAFHIMGRVRSMQCSEICSGPQLEYCARRMQKIVSSDDHIVPGNGLAESWCFYLAQLSSMIDAKSLASQMVAERISSDVRKQQRLRILLAFVTQVPHIPIQSNGIHSTSDTPIVRKLADSSDDNTVAAVVMLPSVFARVCSFCTIDKRLSLMATSKSVHSLGEWYESVFHKGVQKRLTLPNFPDLWTLRRFLDWEDMVSDASAHVQNGSYSIMLDEEPLSG